MLKEPAREMPTQTQRHASARTSVVYRRLLSGVAAIALMYGLVEGNYAWSNSTDPFATAGRPAAEGSVAIPDFVPIVEAAKPAVVSIRVKSRVKTTPQVDPFEGTPFEPFFLLAVRRLGRHRLRYSGRDRQERHHPTGQDGSRRARLARGRDPAGDEGDRRQPRAQVGFRCARRRIANGQPGRNGWSQIR